MVVVVRIEIDDHARRAWRYGRSMGVRSGMATRDDIRFWIEAEFETVLGDYIYAYDKYLEDKDRGNG